MLPFFFQHYDSIVDRYFVFDNGSTDGSLTLLANHGRVEVSHFDVRGDSFVEEERQLGNSMWRNSKADWVIVTDIDEHLYHPDLRGYLKRCTKDRITAIESRGFEMVAESFPSGTEPLVEQVTMGTRSIGHNRLCIFNPKAIKETNFNAGRHKAEPKGRVKWPELREVLLLHYKQLGAGYLVERSAELRTGLRPGDLANNWGVHYTWRAEEIIAGWQTLKESAEPVPGLGILKHVEPAKYFEDEYIVNRSGLFLSDWYLEAYPDVQWAGVPPFAHYCSHGWREGRRPNFYFDPEWYCKTYPQLVDADSNPLVSFILKGEKEDAMPSRNFDTAWYRKTHDLGEGESPLGHFLERRTSGLVSPLPDFDAADYCASHPEVLEAGKDPFEDYCGSPMGVEGKH
jgi:hypothetical protein